MTNNTRASLFLTGAAASATGLVLLVTPAAPLGAALLLTACPASCWIGRKL